MGTPIPETPVEDDSADADGKGSTPLGDSIGDQLEHMQLQQLLDVTAPTEDDADDQASRDEGQASRGRAEAEAEADVSTDRRTSGSSSHRPLKQKRKRNDDDDQASRDEGQASRGRAEAEAEANVSTDMRTSGSSSHRHRARQLQSSA
jgi:hypothetical protein